MPINSLKHLLAAGLRPVHKRTRLQAWTREVLDFVGYLRERQERREWRNLAAAQTGSLAPVWDNAEDEVWNDA